MAEKEDYSNKVAEFLSNFLPKTSVRDSTDDRLKDIAFDAPKVEKMPIEDLAKRLDQDLRDREWFVTGQVNPIYFSDDFVFQDPDVRTEGGIEGKFFSYYLRWTWNRTCCAVQEGTCCAGAVLEFTSRPFRPLLLDILEIITNIIMSSIKEYARGVSRIFDEKTARAEIISTVVNATVPNIITCTWRLSGRVKVGPGLHIKPYIVYTDFTVDRQTGLIVFQEDRFSIPGWDILLSSFFPFLIGRVTSPAAAPVDEQR